MVAWSRVSLLTLVVFQIAGCPYVAERIDTGAVVDTSLGSFTIRLETDDAPEATAAFAVLVDSGYYENTLFHEVDPTSLVRAGGYELGLVLKETGDPIVNESDNGLLNLSGTIGMARTSDVDSATAQFYFNVVDNDSLDATSGADGYTVFGEIVQGFSVIQSMSVVTTTTRNGLSDVPEEDVIIESIERVGRVNGKMRVLISTSLGDITVDLDGQLAPLTVDNFLEYVDADFYDDTVFHRVVPNFIVQGGGYTLGPVALSDSGVITNESVGGLSNKLGRVALLQSDDDEDVAVPEFFVNLADNAQYDAVGDTPGCPVFGTVVSGLDVVEQIAAVTTYTLNDFADLPLEDLLIEQITLVDLPTGTLELTEEGQYYADSSTYGAISLIRELLSTVIVFGVANSGG